MISSSPCACCPIRASGSTATSKSCSSDSLPGWYVRTAVPRSPSPNFARISPLTTSPVTTCGVLSGRLILSGGMGTSRTGDGADATATARHEPAVARRAPRAPAAASPARGLERRVLVEHGEDLVGVAVRYPQDDLVDAERRVVVELGGLGERAEGHDAQLLRVAPAGLEGGVELRERGPHAGAAEGDPAVAVLRDVAEQCRPRGTTDQGGRPAAL